MSDKTRKHIWPVSLITALGIVAVLALMAATVWMPGSAQAQGGPPNPFVTPMPGTTPAGPTNPFATPAPSTTRTGDMITSDSTSGGSAPEFKVVIDSLPAAGLAVGSSIVLYLEDDYQEPATIPASSVYFVAEPARASTGNGARVYTTNAPKVANDAYFDEDKDDISIRVFIPDMCTSSTTACQGPNGVDANQTLTMVIEDGSGIKNPTEAGTHSVL